MVKALCFLAMFLPQGMKRIFYNIFLGAEIDATARIGFSFVHAKKIKMGAYARIGRLNVIRNLELLEIGQHSSIGHFNYMSALPVGSIVHFVHEKERYPAFIMGEHSSAARNHFFDCNNTIRIGNFSAIAGRGSQFYTHGINLEDNRQETDVICIGDYCRVATQCVVIKGAVLPLGSTLAANSTLHKDFTEPYALYSGVPAVFIRKFNPDWPYFQRKKGFVD